MTSLAIVSEVWQFVTLSVTIAKRIGGNLEIDDRFGFPTSREETSCGDSVAADL